MLLLLLEHKTLFLVKLIDKMNTLVFQFIMYSTWVIASILIKLYLYLIPTFVITLSIGVMVSANPIYSLLALMAVFFHMVAILLSAKLEFLAMIFLIIYIGAISILFLFVIMMFNLKVLSKPETGFLCYLS